MRVVPAPSIDDPRVRIVVPSFQQGQYLPYALEGLSRQTYRALETTVFDNVSTDTSDEVLRLFAGRVTRIVRAPDRGQSDALKTGFHDAGADLLGWLNADDMILPDTIERVTSIFRNHPEVDVVYGHCAFLSEKGQFLGYFHDIQDFSLRDLLNFSDFIPQPSTFFRRRAYEAVGGIDPSLHYVMDWDLWCRMARAGCRFHRVDEVLAAARLHDGAKTSRGGRERMRELWRVNRRHAWGGLPLLTTAQLYHRYLRRFAGPLAALPRFAWSTVLRAPRSSATVMGFGADGRVEPGRFRIRFPVFAPLSALRLSCDAPHRLELDDGSGALTGASRSDTSTQIEWQLPAPTFTTEIDVGGTLASGQPMAIDVTWT